jgi:hypothetical protein
MAKRRQGAPFTRIVQDIPATVPFLAPEAIERRSGKALTLRLGANESAFGPSPLAVEVMCAAATQVNWYGDPESYDLRAALAGRHGVGMENNVIGCGIDDLLELHRGSLVLRQLRERFGKPLQLLLAHEPLIRGRSTPRQPFLQLRRRLLQRHDDRSFTGHAALGINQRVGQDPAKPRR